MTAWKPPERVVVYRDILGFLEAAEIGIYDTFPDDEPIYIPEATAQERERVLREALEHVCPAEEGFTEAFGYLRKVGLLVEVPADDEYRAEWDSDTMWVWRWNPLARAALDSKGGGDV